MQAKAQVQAEEQRMSTDKGRVWLWSFLAVIALSQLYVVKELLAAFALFAIGFAALALVVALVYVLQKSWELAISRVAGLRRPVLNMTVVGNLAGVSRENRKVA